MELKNLVTVKQLAAEVPGFTEAGIRHLLFTAAERNLQSAVIKVGRKVLIDREEFLLCLREAGTVRGLGRLQGARLTSRDGQVPLANRMGNGSFGGSAGN